MQKVLRKMKKVEKYWLYEKLIANTTLTYTRHSQQREREWGDDAQSISDMALFLFFDIFEKSAKWRGSTN